MGMFDTVLTDKDRAIRCPGCKGRIDSFQTKDVENLMYEYQEGQNTRTFYGYKPGKIKLKGSELSWPEIDLEDKRTAPHPVYMQVYTYHWCDKCNKMVAQNFRFDETGMLQRFGDPFFEVDE